MEKGEEWVRGKCSKNFTEPGIGMNFHKFKNSVSTKHLKNMLLKHVTLEVSLSLVSDKGTISNGFFSALYWRSSQYNKTRKRNKVYELETRRSMLNALLTINLTFARRREVFPKLESLAYPFLVFHICVELVLLFTKFSPFFKKHKHIALSNTCETVD